MNDVKGWLASQTVWAGIIGFAATVLALFHVDFGMTDQAATVDAITKVVAGAADLWAIYGRIIATKRLLG